MQLRARVAVNRAVGGSGATQMTGGRRPWRISWVPLSLMVLNLPHLMISCASASSNLTDCNSRAISQILPASRFTNKICSNHQPVRCTHPVQEADEPVVVLALFRFSGNWIQCFERCTLDAQHARVGVAQRVDDLFKHRLLVQFDRLELLVVSLSDTDLLDTRKRIVQLTQHVAGRIVASCAETNR